MEVLLFSEWKEDQDLVLEGLSDNLFKNYKDFISNICALKNNEEKNRILDSFQEKINSILPKDKGRKKKRKRTVIAEIGGTKNGAEHYFRKYKKIKTLPDLQNTIKEDRDFEKFYVSLVDNYIEHVSIDLLKNVDFGKLSEVNSLLSKKGNPIFKIKKDYKTGNILIDTFSYVAEFQIPLKDSTKFLKIKIEPRDLVGKKMFVNMLYDIFEVGYLESVSGKEENNEFIELFYNTFLMKLKAALNGGIYREYNEKEENLRNLRGSLMVYKNYIENKINKSKLYCRFEEFNDNNIINRTLVKALYKIGHSSIGKSSFIQSNANNILNSYFDNYTDILSNFKESQITNIIYNKQNQRYKDVIRYCINILRNISGTFDVENNIDYDAFYIDMSYLFESFIGKRLQKYDEIYTKQLFVNIKEDALEENNYYVELQYDKEYLDQEKVFRIKPDIVLFENSEKPLLVADTKYKRLMDNKEKNYNIDSNDVYQILAYAEKFKTKNALLIYPKPLGYKINIPVFEIGDKNLFVAQVDLSDTASDKVNIESNFN